MALPRPSRDDLKAVGDSLDLALRDDDLDLLHRAVLGSMGTFDVLDTLPDHLPPVRFPRGPVSRPTPDENPLNGWAARCEVKGAAEGLLQGRTVALKDNICLAGVPMTNGSATLEGYVPDVDATVVTRVLEAGGTILGKTTNEHFCLSAGSHTHPSGPVLNPWRQDRTTGGSSSGAAAVVAAGDADMAIGGDQGGSIRVPAAFCGLVGLKPSFGLVPYTGIMAIEASLDHTEPMTRTVADNARLLQVLAGPDGLDPRQTAGAPAADYLGASSRGVSGLRIALLKEGFGQPDADPQVEAKVRDGAEVLARLGVEISEVSVPGHRLGPALWLAIASGGVSEGLMAGNGVVGGRGLHVTGLHEAHAHWRERTDDLSDPVKVVMLLGRHLQRSYGGRFYAKAQNLSRKLRADYDAALANADLLLLPTTPVQAPRVLDRRSSRAAVLAGSRGNLENTSPFNVTGHPAISLPCGLIDGVPTGLMLVARHGDEATLYAAAAAFEAALDRRG